MKDTTNKQPKTTNTQNLNPIDKCRRTIQDEQLITIPIRATHAAAGGSYTCLNEICLLGPTQRETVCSLYPLLSANNVHAITETQVHCKSIHQTIHKTEREPLNHHLRLTSAHQTRVLLHLINQTYRVAIHTTWTLALHISNTLWTRSTSFSFSKRVDAPLCVTRSRTFGPTRVIRSNTCRVVQQVEDVYRVGRLTLQRAPCTQ